jgi:TPP-dependent pyruvate/acetoin dehydrogenase alpha subunit
VRPVAAANALELLKTMRLIREAETRLAQLFADGEIPGFIHSSVGQEAVAVGVTAALKPGDTLASNHRGHGHAIAKGVDLDRFFLEIMGKADGICKGRGGSMHIADMTVGMLGANGIVAAGAPIAGGSALAHQVRKTGCISAVFFGDGALAEGALHESLNLAAVWKLPVLFVCENNGWSEFTPTARQYAGDACALARSHTLPAISVDGNDVLKVHAAASQLAEEARAGGGPRFLECLTRRWRGHFEGDPQKYRDPKEVAAASDDDPIVRLERHLVKGGTPAADVEAALNQAAERVAAAVARARRAAAPSAGEALADVYTPWPGGQR